MGYLIEYQLGMPMPGFVHFYRPCIPIQCQNVFEVFEVFNIYAGFSILQAIWPAKSQWKELKNGRTRKIRMAAVI